MTASDKKNFSIICAGFVTGIFITYVVLGDFYNIHGESDDEIWDVIHDDNRFDNKEDVMFVRDLKMRGPLVGLVATNPSGDNTYWIYCDGCIFQVAKPPWLLCQN